MWEHEHDEVEYWQGRAAQARGMAVNLVSERSRVLITKIAERFDEYAATAERARKIRQNIERVALPGAPNDGLGDRWRA